MHSSEPLADPQPRMSSSRKTQSFYDADAATYDRQRWSSPAGTHNNRIQLAIARDMLTTTEGCWVEIGPGTGRFSHLIAEHVDTLILVDVAAEMLRGAHARAPSTELVLSDACLLPFADNSLAGIVCLNVLNHIEQYETALGEIARVLRPGGMALLNFNNLASPYFLAGLLVNYRHRAFRADVFSHWLAWPTFARALEQVGLNVTAKRGHLHVPTWLPRVAYQPLIPLDRVLRRYAAMSPVPFVLVSKPVAQAARLSTTGT